MFKKIFLSTQNFFQRILSWLLRFPPIRWLVNILKIFWRILVPVLLIGLLVVPIVLTYFPAGKKTVNLNVPKLITKGDVVKKISVQAVVENSYSYDLPVYQDAELKEVFVKQGDQVTAGQVLASLEFVNENKVRSTDVQNQINSYLTDISNQQEALGNTLNSNYATLSQQDINVKNKVDEWNQINQKRIDKINENHEKKSRYDSERIDFQKQYDELDSRKVVDNSVKQYEDQLKLKHDQLTTGNSGSSQIQSQINTVESQISGFKTTLGLSSSQSCSSYVYVIPSSTTISSTFASSSSSSALPNLTSTKDQCLLAEKNLNELRVQQNVANNNTNVSVNTLNNDINDLQNKINILKKDPSYTGNKPTITDQLNDSQIEIKKGDLKSKITTRENDIKQIDNSVEVKNLEEQLKTIDRGISDLLAQQQVSQQGLESTKDSVLQRIRSAQSSLEGSQSKLNDIIEDINKQEKNKTLVAKKDGIVGKVNKEQGLVLNAREVEFTIVSPDQRLKFTVNADNKSQIKKGMKVNTDKYKDIENIVVTDANLIPNTLAVGATASTTLEYDVFANLPKSNKYNYTQGESVNIDVIIDQKKDVLNVPFSAVLENKVYVGTGVELPKGKKIKTNSNSTSSSNANDFIIVDEDETKFEEIKTSTSSSSSKGADQAASQLVGVKFTAFKEVKIETGLNDGRNIEVLSGLNSGDFVFIIYPKTDAEKKQLEAEYLVKK